MSGAAPGGGSVGGAAPGVGSPRRAHPGGAPDGALRILMATPPFTAVGPIPRLTALLVGELESLGCHVTTVDWGSGPGQTSASQRSFGRLKDMRAVWRQACASSCDVVVVASAHYRNTLARDIPLMLGLRAARRPAVLQFHGSQPEVLLRKGRPLFKLASRLLLATSSGILVLSGEEKRAWERFRPKTMVYVVKNPYGGIPGASAAAEAGEPQTPHTAQPPIILFVGRLLAFKGVYDLLEAAQRLATAHAELPFQIVMAGDGPEAPAIAALADRLGIGARVVLRGQVDPQALRALYRQATLFVLPSHLEGFPTVIAEAMDARLPIVTTAIRGAVDYLEEGVNALLVPPREPARLADALAALLADPELRGRMGEANRQKVSIFAPDKVAAEYLDVLRQIAGRTGTGS